MKLIIQSVLVFPLDNLWGNYGPDNMVIEKKNLSSVPAEANNDKLKNYVFNDWATYFTLLVGIYFPSVTGRQFTVVTLYKDVKSFRINV